MGLQAPGQSDSDFVKYGDSIYQAIPGSAYAATIFARDWQGLILMGTHNAVLSLGPRLYLEVIAVDPSLPAPGRPRWFDLDEPRMKAELAEGPVLATWVARTRDLEDRRSYRLSLTAKGTKLYEKIAPTANKRYAELISSVPPEELDALVATLRTMIARAEELN